MTMRLVLLRCLLLGGSLLPALEAFQVSPRRGAITRAIQQRQPSLGGGFSTIHDRTNRCPHSSTQLSMFLPPGGGGGKKSELGQVAAAVLTFAGLAAFFLSPLGGIFFAVFNSILALSILIPVGGFVAFQVWSYFNTVSGACPNCGAAVTAMKDGSPSLCFNCGAICAAKNDSIYLANPNQGDIFAEDREPSVMSWFDGINGSSGASPRPGDRKRSTTTTTIIDVEVKRDDD